MHKSILYGQLSNPAPPTYFFYVTAMFSSELGAVMHSQTSQRLVR